MAFRKIRAALVNSDVEQFVGEIGNLFFDITDGTLRLSDGVTPGGNVVSSGSGSSDYTLPTASTTTKGGVKVDGTSITINNGVISATQPNLSSYATQSYVTSRGYALTSDIPSLAGYATESYVTGRGYITSSALSGYATESYVTGRGYLTAYTETDPVFLAHAANNVTTTKISNWDTAYGWGNHSVAGYLTDIPNTISTVSKTGADPATAGYARVLTVTTNPADDPSNWQNDGSYPDPAIITIGGVDVTCSIYITAGGALELTVIDSDLGLVSVGDSGILDGIFTNGYGSVTFNNVIVTAATISAVAATAIDLTKSINELSDGAYSLADGAEGQRLYLVTQSTVTSPSTIIVIVSNHRTTGSSTTDYSLYPFTNSGMCSLLFTNGSWQNNVITTVGSLLWTNPSPAPSTPWRTTVNAANGNANIVLYNGVPGLGSSVSWTFDETKLTFPDASVQTTAWTGLQTSVTGNAGTVTNGVYTTGSYANPSWITSLAGSKVTNAVLTTSTGTVTNAMLAGSIANAKLVNNSITINGSATALGGSVTISTITGNAGTATKLAATKNINGVAFDGSADITVTADANTLSGTTLKSTVVSSSLTSVGTLTGVTSNAATAFIAGTAAESGVALQMPREGAIRNLYNGTGNNMYFDVSAGGASQGQFQFRSSNAFTNVLTMSPTAFNVNPDATVTARSPSLGRLAWNSVIDTELTIDDYRFRVSNSGGIFPQIISNVSGQTKNTAWTAVGAISGDSIKQAGSTGNLVPNNSWVSLYTLHGMDSPGDTVTVTLQDKNLGRIYRITFMRSDNGILTGYNIIAERLL